MYSYSNFKINTATAIFFVFTFRLFFISTYALTSTQNSQPNSLLTSHLSVILKRRQTNGFIAKSNQTKTTKTVMCLEFLEYKLILNNLKPTSIISFLCSHFKQIVVSSKATELFNSIKCKLYPKRYLALSLLRI